MTGAAGGRAGHRCQTVGWLRERVVMVEARCQAVTAERDRLAGEVERLRADNQRLVARVGVLVARVEELRRAGKRQAAPFSKDRPAPHPRRPGRKAGAAYGRHGRRPVPQRVDRVVAVALPDACPGCGGELRLERVASQYQEDLPPPQTSVICCYQVQVGRCQRCRRRVQPRHPGQTSDALGAAGVQLGPRAVALAAWCSKGLGLSAGKVALLLGQGYAGVLERDGWAPYRKFAAALHQTCVAHLLRRVGELLVDAKRGQAKTPHAIGRILRHALWVGDRRDAGQLTAAAAAGEAGRLGAAVDKLVAGRTVDAPNRKLLDHLGKERGALFTFPVRQGVQATNWRAEQAIRPAVVGRKQWGGNATWDGAESWQILASVARTATLQQRDPVGLLVGLLLAPGPVVADLAIPGLARGP